jgi:hypothetical protein
MMKSSRSVEEAVQAGESGQLREQEKLKMRKQWSAGDWAVYRKSKRSTSPGPRAENVIASPKGDSYTYVVDKFWVVERVLPDDHLLMRTARGKTHRIDVSDPSLRKASLLQRLFWRHRFLEAQEHCDSDARQSSGESEATGGPRET